MHKFFAVKKVIFLLTFFLSPLLNFACECPQLDELNKDLRSKYDLIFLGKVDSVSSLNKNNCIAWFTVSELFHGSSPEKVKIQFDCKTECQMNFNLNEEWLVYASYTKFAEVLVNVCSRTRKKIENEADDYYVVTNGTRFTDELVFLESNFGTKQLERSSKPDSVIPERKNIQPDPYSKLYLILVSLVLIGFLYFVFKKWVK